MEKTYQTVVTNMRRSEMPGTQEFIDAYTRATSVDERAEALINGLECLIAHLKKTGRQYCV